MSNDNFKAYIGKTECGAIVAATVDEDDPKRKKHVAADVAEFIKEGLSIEHVDGKVVRQEFCNCPKIKGEKWDDACRDRCPIVNGIKPKQGNFLGVVS